MCFRVFAAMALVLQTLSSCSSPAARFSGRCVSELSLNADSVAATVSLAQSVWDSTPWSVEYNDATFEEYLLPPRVADEPLEYWWRKDIPCWIKGDAAPGDEMLALSRRINAIVDVTIRPEAWGNPQMGYSKTLTGVPGKCDDRAILLAMALRSYGIPAAFDFVPAWGRKNNGHSFCSVVRPDGSSYVFQDRQDNGTDVVFSDIPPKIYRRTFFEQMDSPIYRRRGKESIPAQFGDCRFKDVTRLHGVRCRDVRVRLDFVNGNRLAYLAVFSPQGWIPVAYGEVRGRTARFKDVGMDILYLPCLYGDSGLVPAASPIIVRQDAVEEIVPDGTTTDVLLTRKYPRSERMLMFAGYMNGGVFETASEPDFSDARQLFRIDGIPHGRMQERACDVRCRYARYRKASGVFSLGEMIFRDNAGSVLGGEIVCPTGLEDMPGIENVTDGNPLTYLEISGLTDIWVGLDFGREIRLGSVGYCPRTDDNDISPDDSYELLFWGDREWSSLGIVRAESYELQYSGVPSGALLWLRDISRGKEERPFLYKDGAQVWL